MNLERFKKEVRPTGGVHTAGAVTLMSPEMLAEPMIVIFDGKEHASLYSFVMLAPKLAYGSVALFLHLKAGTIAEVSEAVEMLDFRQWHQGPNFPGLPEGSCTWVRSHYDGSTYATHLPYLLEAAKRTTGPILELGAGEGSTPALHEICLAERRMLVTVDNSIEWIEKFTHLMADWHRFEHLVDPAKTEWLDWPHWGVVFVDHSPGNSRRYAIERARGCADYVVAHDTEELGYGLEDLLSTFKYRKDFRYSRPWTTIASDRQEVW